MSPPAHATKSHWFACRFSRSNSSMGTIGRMTGTLSPRRAELRLRTLYQTATVPIVTGTIEQRIARPSSRSVQSATSKTPSILIICHATAIKPSTAVTRARPAGIA